MTLNPASAAGLRQHLTTELARVRAALADVPDCVRGPAHREASQHARECALLLRSDDALLAAAYRLTEAHAAAAPYLH
jgi:hypothetical protein